MFSTSYNGKEYTFHDDHMTRDGLVLDYSKMTEIAHKAGETPAIVFTYDDQRITMPYNKEEYKKVLPYFIHANKLKPEEEAAEAAVVEGDTYTEQPSTGETQIPADEGQEEAQIEEPATEEPAPETPAEAEAETFEVEPSPKTEAGVAVAAESAEDSTTAAEFASEATVDPETNDFENTSEPQAAETQKSNGLAGSLKALPMKKVLIAAAIIVAIIIAIIAIVASLGKSVDGLNDRVKLDTVTTESGDEYKIAVIDEDVTVEDFAVDYHAKCFKDGDKVQWVYNKKTDQTIMFADQNEAVLVCVYEHVDGEESDPSLLGTGKLRESWILYPQTGELMGI